MAFESAHGLTVDGEAGPKVWSALLQAVALRQVTTAPYDYVVVSQTLPETASVWRDGQIIFTTLVNTGIAVAPTAPGTYPVFARYLVTTMTGKNPDGKPYSDPGIPWVSYFNGGDALHGYIRASYGFPQSLGCVEMTYANAETMFPLTPLGTLVTVLAEPGPAASGVNLGRSRSPSSRATARPLGARSGSCRSEARSADRSSARWRWPCDDLPARPACHPCSTWRTRTRRRPRSPSAARAGSAVHASDRRPRLPGRCSSRRARAP